MSTKEKWALWGLIVPFGAICLGLVIALIATVNETYWITSVAWAALLMALFAILGALRWLPSTPDDDEYAAGEVIFCEGYEDGWIKQPIAVWSDLAFMAAGLAIVLIAGTGSAAPSNPMSDSGSAIPLVYALAVIFMGPGSMFFHASMKKWGGWCDNMSIIIWAAFSFSYTLARLFQHWFGWPLWTLWILAGIIIGAAGLITAIWPGTHRWSQIITGGAFFLVELVLMIAIWSGSPPGFERSTGWFLAVLGAFAAAFACWMPSGAVWKAWCDHDSPVQGHGFWHLLAAIGTLLVYCYFASEVPV